MLRLSRGGRSGPARSPEREDQLWAALGRPRQMAAKRMFEGSVPGAGARSVGVLARDDALWPSRLKLLGNRSENDDLLLVSRGPDGPGLSLRRIVVPRGVTRNPRPRIGGV